MLSSRGGLAVPVPDVLMCSHICRCSEQEELTHTCNNHNALGGCSSKAQEESQKIPEKKYWVFHFLSRFPSERSLKEHCHPPGVWPGTVHPLEGVSAYQNILSGVTVLASKAVTSRAVTAGDIRGLAGTVAVTSPSAVCHHRGAPSKGDSGGRAEDSHISPVLPRAVTELAVPRPAQKAL